MRILSDKRGISVVSIILFGLLVLSMVLLNGISIRMQQQRAAQAKTDQRMEALKSNCNVAHERFPEICAVRYIYECGEQYILRSECIGVGDVILNNDGSYKNWCGYTSLDGPPIGCDTYWIDGEGNDCTKTNNLCIQ